MDTTNTNTGVDTTTENNTPKTYTQEEVDKLLQQEGDRRVTEAFKKAEDGDGFILRLFNIL